MFSSASATISSAGALSRSPRGGRSARRARRRTRRRRSRRPDRAVDLAVRGHVGRGEEALRIPEVRAQQRLRALRVRLVDLDEDAELRHLALDRARREQLGVGGERRAAVDAERLGHAGHEEQQPDVRVGEDVAQRVGDPVARPLGQQQRAVVEDPDEPGRVAAGAEVAVAAPRPTSRCTGTATARCTAGSAD